MNAFQKYADYYDVIYHDKDYRAECDFLESIFKKYFTHPIRSILDIGCGTGGHALILAERGYEITGIDISAEMLEIGKTKAKNKGLHVKFIHRDVRKLGLDEQFDAAIAMFAVMNYQTTNEDLQNAFGNIRKCLKKGGLFIFDFWFGPAVLAIKPSDRLKIMENGNEKIIRFATPQMDIINHTVTTNYKVLKISNSRVLNEVRESHKVRFLFPQEVTHYLEESGFKVLRLCTFMEFEKMPTVDDWNATAIAQGM